MTTTDISVNALTSLQGCHHILFERAGHEAILPASDCYETRLLFLRLAERGLPVPGKSDKDLIVEKIASILFDGPPVHIAEHVGWSGDSFVLPNGHVIHGTHPPLVAFGSRTPASLRQGTVKAWREEVAIPLIGQQLATFVLAMAFAAPLMDLVAHEHNYVFVLVGEPGTGKSTLQQLAASVVGPPTHRASIPFVVSLTQLMDKSRGSLAMYRDLPLIIDHLAEYLVAATSTQHLQVLRLVTSQLLTGVIDGGGHPIRTIALFSSTVPLLAALGANRKDHRSLDGRILTIPIPQGQHGVFDSLPPSANDSQAFSHALIAAAEANHGTAFARFMEMLTRKRVDDASKLAARINGDISRFCESVAIDPNCGAAVRIANTFGLVYAAGKLAQRYRCLPKNMDVLAAAQHCYGLHRKQSAQHGSFIKRLNELCSGSQVARLDSDSPEVIAEADIIVGKCKGKSERWIRPDAIEVLFPDWQRIKNDPDVTRLRVCDVSKPTTTRRAGPQGKQVPMYVFRKPATNKEVSPV